MSRILPMMWTAFGATIVLSAHDFYYWSFAAVCVGGAAAWCEVAR